MVFAVWYEAPRTPARFPWIDPSRSNPGTPICGCQRHPFYRCSGGSGPLGAGAAVLDHERRQGADAGAGPLDGVDHPQVGVPAPADDRAAGVAAAAVVAEPDVRVVAPTGSAAAGPGRPHTRPRPRSTRTDPGRDGCPARP